MTNLFPWAYTFWKQIKDFQIFSFLDRPDFGLQIILCFQLITCPRMMSITSSAMWIRMVWSGEQVSLSSSVQKMRRTSWLLPHRSVNISPPSLPASKSSNSRIGWNLCQEAFIECLTDTIENLYNTHSDPLQNVLGVLTRTISDVSFL